MAFGEEFERWIGQFSAEKALIPDAESLRNLRYINRSIAPHVIRLSALFNRAEKDQSSGLEPYWKGSSNPQHFRLAYFLYFMPSNLYRVAAVWSELERLGFRWNCSSFNAIEFGAGPASGACGIAAGERYAPLGLPKVGTWALIEQDKSILNLGVEWAETYFPKLGFDHWNIRPFHRKIDPSKEFLPRAAPKFNLWLMSYYLNETTVDPKELAVLLIKTWDRHLEDEGLVILVEPAMKLQSRRLLELRAALLNEIKNSEIDWLKILLPCLGHQTCGALANPEDWCHEDVSWWRPPYFRAIDKIAGLDRKSLPFSYLVIAKSKKSREDLLPALKPSADTERYRLVSPAHSVARDEDFYLCGQDGKHKARYRPTKAEREADPLGRGDILVGAEVKRDPNLSRVEKFKVKV